MRRALAALLVLAACSSSEPQPEPIALTPIGERPAPKSVAEAPPREAPAETAHPAAEDPAPPPAVSGPAWIQATAVEDEAPSGRLAQVLEPLRERFALEGLELRGSLRAHYDGAKFFGQVQAHNYHGLFDLVLVLPDGAEHVLQLKHSWGRLPKNATREEVCEAFYLDLDQALEAWVFGFPAVQALSSDPEGLAAAAEASRLTLLERLKKRLPRGRLAKAAHGWTERGGR